MTEAEMFRDRATQCDRLAEGAFTESARQELREQAAECRRQAEKLEQIAEQRTHRAS